MAKITFSSDSLRKLLRINYYNFSETSLMVFGIRGATAVSADFSTFKFSHEIERTDPNYNNPKCSIGIWNPVTNQIALFPGSTVPHTDYMKKNLVGTAKANCMMTGYYSYYQKGFHNPSVNGAHEALRLATNIVLRRSNNDLVFTNDDPIEVGNPSDNIHAAYCFDSNGKYSSAGCQVIVGQPNSKGRGPNSVNTGYWKIFHDIIYGVPQQHFDYALFRYVDAEVAAISGSNPLQARLRFGSKGDVVNQLQQKLTTSGNFHTNADGDFGRNTLMAVLEYQKAKFGLSEADGVVGNGTATSLGLILPSL